MSRRRRKKQQTINPDDIHPEQAAGLTQGIPKEEVLKQFPEREFTSGVEALRHMGRETPLEGSRQPRPHFVAEDDDNYIWVDGTGRVQRDVVKTYTQEGFRLLQEGRQCLRCDEPHPIPFPEECDLCGYAMKARQIMDIAMEFEGTKHLGPGKPMTEYLMEQDERVEKRKFQEKLLRDGHVPGIIVPR